MITTNYGRDVYKKPSFIQPAYSINGATTQSDKTGEPNHRFLFDIYVNEVKVARVKSLASYLDYASVEISDILKNYVEDEFTHLTPRPTPDEDRQTNNQLYVRNSTYTELKSVKILAGEEYKVNGVLTIFDGNDNTGDPEVYVSSWYSSYHAMDANSEEVLRAAGDLTNVQFSSNHLDVLERINRGGLYFAGYTSGSSNFYKTFNSDQYNILYHNDNIKELSHRPLKRLRFEGIPQSASFYETNYITLWNAKNNSSNPANYERATIGRNFFNDDEVVEPFGRIEPYNNYRQRIQTIGYEFYDPSGLLVDEVRYQPNSPVFDQPIYDTFGFDYVSTGAGRFTGQGEAVSISNQRKIETGWEYVKFNTFKEGGRINITQALGDGDFVGLEVSNILQYFSGPITDCILARPNVKYMDGDKICDYQPPKVIETTYEDGQDGNSVLGNFVGFDSLNAFKDIEKLKTHKVNANSQDSKASTFSCYVRPDKNNVAGFLGQFPDPYTIGEVGDNGGYSPTQYQGPVSTGEVGYWKFTWDFYEIPDRITIIKNGTATIFDSGVVSNKGVFIYDTISQATDTFQVRIDTYDPGTLWEFYVRVAATPWPHNPSIMIPDLAQGNNFMIVEDTQENTGLIVGLDATLPEQFNGPYPKYEFNLAPGLRVYNQSQSRNATYEEIKSLTGRSIEGINYVGLNGRNVIEVLTAFPIGQNVSVENGMRDREKVLITFQINPVASTSTMDRFLILPGVYGGVNRKRDWNIANPSNNIYGFGFELDRFRLMNGNDKSLKNANQMKLKLYDFDNNYNLLKEEIGNAGKFTTNIDGWGPDNNFPVGLVHTTLTDTQYFTYGVNGNKWDINTGEGYGYLGDFQNQQKVGRGNMRNIPQSPQAGFIILQTDYSAYAQGQPAWYLSYLLSRNTDLLVGPNQRISGVVGDSPSGKMFIHVSMMVLVKDNPEPSSGDFTNLYLFTPGPIGESVEVSPKNNIYRAEDKGRWKRLYYIAEVPNTDQDANFNYQNRVELRCDLYTNTSYDIWENKDLIFGDVRVSYLFGETDSDRIEEAHKLYDRDLVQINSNQEPHLIESSDLLRNEAHSLFWLNKFGTWDDYRFRARSLKTTEVKRTTRSTGLDKIGTLNSTYVRGKQEFGDTINYSLDATDIFELTTDYVNQEEREWFENIFTSPKHMMYDELTDAFIRVNILNKKYTIINKKNQKLFQLKLEVQVSPENRTLQVLGGY